MGVHCLDKGVHYTAISEDDVDHLYDEHRYDGRLALRIYLLRPEAIIPPSSEMHTALTIEVARIVASQPDISGTAASNLRIGNYNSFGNFLEIEYRYHCPLYYIDAEEHLAETIQTKEGFIWLHASDRFMVVLARDDRIVRPVRGALSLVLKSSPHAVAFSQEIIEDHFPDDELRRVYHQDAESGNKYSASGEYSSLLSYIDSSDQTFQRTGALYRKEVLPGVMRNVGVSAKLGKLYFTRTMSSAQVREWAMAELPSVVSDIRRLESDHVPLIRQSDGIRRLRVSEEAKTIIGAISNAVCYIMGGGPREVSLHISGEDILSTLGVNYVKASVSGDCADSGCEDVANRCPQCDNRKLDITPGSVTCPGCSTELLTSQTVRLKCAYDHTTDIDLADCLYLRPARKLTKILADDLRSIGITLQPLNNTFEISSGLVRVLSGPASNIVNQTTIFHAGRDISNVQSGHANRMDVGNGNEEAQ